MDRQLADAVIPGFPSSVPAEAFPTSTPRSSREALQLLESLRPTRGNLADEESWQRMLGGRNRYNHERQQIAWERRSALLVWMLENRMFLRFRPLGWLGMDYIIVQHGDGAMLARALGLGKATICRDLSALQATHPDLFGKPNIGMSYAEYMMFWRYARQAGMGNPQPDHNLRFPSNQHGPDARTRRCVVRALGRDVYQAAPQAQPVAETVAETVEETVEARDSEERVRDESDRGVPTAEEFLAMLDQNCPRLTPQAPDARRRRVLRNTVTL